MRLCLPDAHAPHSHAPHSHAPHTRQNAVKKAAKDAEAAERKTEKEAQACRCLMPGLGLAYLWPGLGWVTRKGKRRPLGTRGAGERRPHAIHHATPSGSD